MRMHQRNMVKLSFVLLSLTGGTSFGQTPYLDRCFGTQSGSTREYKQFSSAIDHRGDLFVFRYGLSRQLEARIYPTTAWDGDVNPPWFTVPSGNSSPLGDGYSLYAVTGNFGPYTAIWRTHTGAVFARSFDSTGAPYSGDVTIVSTSYDVCAAAYPDGSYIVVVQETDDSLRAYRYSAVGAPTGPVQALIDQVDRVGEVVVTAEGGLIVSAEVDSESVVYRFAADLTPIDGPIATTSGERWIYSGVSHDPDSGRFLVHWGLNTGIQYEIHGDIFDEQGAYQASLGRTDRPYWPKVSSATFTDGTFVVVTHDSYPFLGAGPITMQRYDDRGLTLGRMKEIGTPPGENVISAARVASSPGGTVLTYSWAHWFNAYGWFVDSATFRVCRLRAPASPFTDLISSWPFDGPAGGTEVPDQVGSHDGLLVGDDPAAVWAAGLFGGGLMLDGATNQVEFGDIGGLAGSGAMSVAGWVRLSDVGDRSTPPGPQVLVSGGGGAGGEVLALFAQTTEGPPRARVLLEGSSGTTTISASAPTSLTAGVWHHLAMTYDFALGELTLYVDGTVAGSATDLERRALSAETPWLRAGASINDDGRLNGTVDDLAVWQKSLDSSEIQSLWSSGYGQPLAAFDHLFSDRFEGGDTEAWPNETTSLADQYNLLLLSRGIGGEYASATYIDLPEATYTYLGQSFSAADGALDGGSIDDLVDLYWKNESLASMIAPYDIDDADGDGTPNAADTDAFEAGVQKGQS